MENYIYRNDLINKKQLRQLLAWSFKNYDLMQACSLADELKSLGFKYSSQAGISISIEDLKIPFVKKEMLKSAAQDIKNARKLYLIGKLTNLERFQSIIDVWDSTSTTLKTQIVYYFKNYDPLNSVYIMASSGARGNLSQVRQLVGMRGLMANQDGELLTLPITKNFQEGLTVTDYLMSGYGARKGIIDTALKTANSGYLTRRLIDVAQDILIREKDCRTSYSFLFSVFNTHSLYDPILGQMLNKSVVDLKTNNIIANKNTQITPFLIEKFKEKNITKLYLRSPFTCNLYRAICQKCYGWDLATENLVDIGQAIGILAGQSIGEPGTQLTMRTFHTGGIFTSTTRDLIKSPVSGVVKISSKLKLSPLRTSSGENVSFIKTDGIILIIPKGKTDEWVKLRVLRNTILYPKNNQYLSKDDVFAESINTKKQIIDEIKPIFSYKSGEILIPSLKKNLHKANNNKMIWILFGQVYNSPVKSFLNFWPDLKLNKYNSIFRSKIVNHYTGSVKFVNQKKSLSQRVIKIKNKKDSLVNAKLYKLRSTNNTNNYILKLHTSKYFVKINEHQSKCYISLTRSEIFGTLITNSFTPLTGGTLYYNPKSLFKNNNTITYPALPLGILNMLWSAKKAKKVKKAQKAKKAKNFNYVMSTIHYRMDDLFDITTKGIIKNVIESMELLPFASICHKTIVWLGEETYTVNCEYDVLSIDDGDFISKKFQLIPGLFSKTSGVVKLFGKDTFIETVSIKSGLVYEGVEFKDTAKKIFYPGEILLGSLFIKNISFCEHILEENIDQLLVRPVEIYEILQSPSPNLSLISNNNLPFNLNSKLVYSYRPGQLIKGVPNINLISSILTFKTNKLGNSNITLELSNNQKTHSVNFNVIEKLCLNNHVSANLKYKNVQSCFLIQENQFISNYTTLGYLEAITQINLEIVKFKIKSHISKQILLISNRDCLTVKKEEFPGKKLNDFIVSKPNQTGKIINQTDTFFIIQCGQLYFFPNSKIDTLSSGYKNNLKYIFPMSPYSKVHSNFINDRDISLHSSDTLKLSLKKQLPFSPS